MSYAVLQKNLDRPPVERLASAFRRVPGLAAVDAHVLGNDAFGILVRRFPYERAYALHVALKAEQIETEVVLESQLPALPPLKFLRRMDCLPEHLRLYDPLGRSFPVEWGHVSLLLAGRVRITEQVRVQTERGSGRAGMERWFGPPRLGGDVNEPVVETHYHHEEREEPLADIVLGRAVQRYRVEASRFNFGCLADRRTGDLESDFASLIRDLARSAPHATASRGVVALRDQTGPPPLYPTRNAFDEELTWLLWQSRPAEST